MVAQIDKAYVRYGWGKVLRRLTSYALFEGRPHTTKGQWFNPFVFSLLRSLTAIPGSPTVDKPVFITGLGRSGTTILGVLLSLHKQVGFLNEPKAIWKLIDHRHDINGDYTDSGGVYRLNAADVTPGARSKAYRLFARYLKTVGASRLVDKYPELIFRVDYLLELFPDARIIFIMRNGADATHSIDLWSRRLGKTTRDGIEDWWGRNDIKWRYLRDQILLKDPAYSSVADVASRNLDHVNRAALEWIVTMQTGIKQAELFPEAVATIKYEDLTLHPEHQLKLLLSKCNLNDDTAVIDYAKNVLYSQPRKPWPVLHPTTETVFRDTMQQLGYETASDITT